MSPGAKIQTPSFRIVCGQEADLPDLEAAHQDCFPEDAWSQDTLQGLLTLPGHQLRLSKPPGTGGRRLSGFCLFRTAADEAEIITLGVVPPARKRGLARTLLQDFTDQASLAGARHLFLEVAEDNGSAVALYQHAGFAVSGRRPGYYDHGRTQPVDALIMEHHLY